MEEKNLQDWVKEIIEPRETFLVSFRRDPAATLQERGFNLHPSYKEPMNQLKPEEREALAQVLVRLADASSPQDLRKLYADWADIYERFFGWEVAPGDVPRGWCI